jgi:ABC-2 type transport system permease protein
MAGFEVKIFAYFPFAWLAKAFSLIGGGKFQDLWGIFLAFAVLILVLSAVVWVIQEKYYFYLFDRLNRNTSGRFRSTWKTGKQVSDYRTLFQKEIKTFIRTPAQWSQLLIIAAIIVVFVLNMKSIPMPHPSFKNLIVYLNLGMAAFIVAGLNSRFTFTTIPMERPGLVHIFASPFDREKLFRFKLLFFMIPQVILGFILFFTADLTLHLEPFARLSGVLFLLPILPFLTLLALFYSLRIEESAPLTPQHLIMTRSGISYMLWSMAAIAASMIYFVRPLFLYYYSRYRHEPVPFLEIYAWFSGFFLFFAVAMFLLFKRSLHLWRKYLL